MKIEILKPIPVAENMRPKVGGAYKVIREARTRETIYFIEVNGEEVGVYASLRRGECRVIPEAKEKASADAGTSNADANH